MPIGPARMPLMDHLGELRMRVVRIIVVLLVASLVFYLATPTIRDIILWPVQDFLPKDANGQVATYVFGAFDAFTVRFKLSIFTAFLACMPIILWQILAFLLPALKPKERKWFIPTFAAGVILFITGTVFCYFIILNPAFEWLLDQTQGFATIFPETSQYIDLILKFLIGFGFAFELPLIIFYLVVFNVVPYKKLRASWRVVYITLMVISAAVTPDASPITMLLMFAALLGLYELSLFVARIVLRKRIKKQNEALEIEKAEDESWRKERAIKKAAKKE